MSVCVNHEFVRAITHQPFKLGLANLDFKCKTLWLRALLFWEVYWLWPSRSNDLKRQILQYFELVHAIANRQFKLRIYKFWPKVYLSNVKIKISIHLGIDWPWPWILFLISNLFLLYQILRLFICIVLLIFSEIITSECSTSHIAPHVC